MLFKLIFVLLYAFFINLSKDNKKVETTNIRTNLNINVEKPSFLKETQKKQKEDLLATLTIENINLYNKAIYNINSTKNNVDNNITILKESIMPDKENSIIFIAAHSGSGNIAYFKDLHKIKKNSIIKLNYKNKDFLYQVNDIYEEDKIGYIKISKSNNKKIILTTCSQNKDKQLIVEGILVN